MLLTTAEVVFIGFVVTDTCKEMSKRAMLTKEMLDLVLHFSGDKIDQISTTEHFRSIKNLQLTN